MGKEKWLPRHDLYATILMVVSGLWKNRLWDICRLVNWINGGVRVDIQIIIHNKKQYIDLLLLADEQETMIDKYLERGDMFVLDDNGIKAECVVTKKAEGIYELKNIAVMPACQRKGYGRKMIDFLFSYYPDGNKLLVGTGDVPSSLNFYHKCGFTESHRIKNFFTDNYDHPMFEDGKQLVDMVYLKRER